MKNNTKSYKLNMPQSLFDTASNIAWSKHMSIGAYIRELIIEDKKRLDSKKIDKA